MIKFSGDAADKELARAWETILGQDPDGQQIIHVLAQPAVEPAWITEFPVYREWLASGCTAGASIWDSFTRTAGTWSYVTAARQAADAGIPNTRILILRRGITRSPLWLRYLATAHLPGISSLAGERLYHLHARTCRTAGLPVRDYDVNLWGAAGIMTAGGDNGDIDWRAFLRPGEDPEAYAAEHAYITAIRDLAVTQGEPADRAARPL